MSRASLRSKCLLGAWMLVAAACAAAQGGMVANSRAQPPVSVPDEAPPAGPPVPERSIVEPARPRADPASLITDADYPEAALRAGQEGLVGYRLEVGANGRVTHCAITRSSGSSLLDSTTCRIMRARARFTPARDSAGNPAESRVVQRFVWKLPAAPLTPAAAPDPVALARLDGFVLGLAEADRFSGVVLVAHHGRILFERAYGRLDEEEEAEATAATRYNLASAGKMFTSVAILQQIAAGRLTLDTRVGEVLKDYPNRAFAGAATIRHLLTHASGAGDVELFGVGNAANRARARSVADMVALHHRRPPAFAPGSKQDYGNFGYVLLGRIVEVLSGEDYEAYVERHIFAPAGMTRTGFVDCADRVPDLAVGYATVDGKRRPNCLTQPLRGFPAGGTVSTARDMYLFTRALQTGRLIPPALFAEATRTHREFMGLGFFATDYGPGIPARDFRWGHGGSSDGVCTEVRVYPNTGETIVVLANRDPPICFAVSGFLHAQWSRREKPE